MSFDLEKAIATWRRPYEVNPAFSAEDLEELEGSLRDRVEALIDRGLPEKEAYHTARRRMGAYGAAETEYRKVYWGKLRRRGELANEFSWRFSMLKNYLKIAWRNVLRHKGYAFTNVFGLTIGLACFVLLFQFVTFQTSFDRFNEKTDQVYRIAVSEVHHEDAPRTTALYGHGVGPAFAQEAPAITRYARVFWDFFQEGPTISYRSPEEELTFKEKRVLYADPGLLQIFTFPLVQGDAATALRQPRTLLLTERTARKYFGDDNPIGKTLEYRSVNFAEGTYTVVGVLKDLPPNSHMQFDILVPMQDMLGSYSNPQSSAWDPDDAYTAYVELGSGASTHAIEQQLTDVLYRNMGDYIAARNTVATVVLQPLSSIYLDRETISGRIATGNPRTVYFFSILAIVMLAIALINYVNSATARALDRATEVGVRKVVGAQRGQLLAQFLLESVLINLTALGLALALAAMLTPVLNQLAQTHLTLATWMSPQFLTVFFGVLLVGILLSGLYPAFVLSSFRPVHALKGNGTEVTSRGTLRKGLVVLQFAASAVLLICTGVVYSQLDYMRHLDVGLDLEHVLVVTSPKVLPEGMDGVEAEMTFKNEVIKLAAISEASYAGNLVGSGFNDSAPAFLDGADPSLAKEARVTGIDHAFSDVYGLDLVAGAPFHENMTPWYMLSGDTPRPVLINEAAVRSLGLLTNQDALGQQMSVSGLRYIVQGVLSDFNWSSVHQPTEAVLFRYLPTNRFLSLKITAADVPGTVASVREIYDTLFPDDLFQYQFADAVYDEQYREDARFATLFSIFAGLAIFIACLGLFGLASFTAARRRKEIGVRKVLGASVGSIVGLLSKDFLVLVGIALLVGAPVAYYAMDQWLTTFAQHITLGPGLFALAGMVASVIALVTVAYQSIRAALADPVKSLRYE